MEKTSEKNLVIFSLEQETYGIDILFVREIIKSLEIVAIPQSPDFVEGIIHLRENIIPIVNLSKRLKLSENKTSPKKRKIIIVEISERLIGLFVDSVGEVLRISDTDINPVPETVATVETRYLQGVIKIEDRIILLMDIDKVLSREELNQLIEQQ